MKFYKIIQAIIKPNDKHIIFPLTYIDATTCVFWIINLTDAEKEELNYLHLLNDKNFQNEEPLNDFEIPLWNFLKPKHTFEVTGNFRGGEEKGINIFYLNENDIMYMKLLI